jgi:hypothetical protein
MDSDYRQYQLVTKRPFETDAYDLDRVFKRNYRNYLNFLNLINYTNHIQFEKRKKRQYQIFVDKGNNSQLILVDYC